MKYIIQQKNIIFIKENKTSNDEKQTLLIDNYNNKLSKTKQEIIDEKLNCFVCNSIIKNESHYFCNDCQKIYHEKCLKDWQKKRSKSNAPLNCPNCRNVLKFKDSKQKLDSKGSIKIEVETIDKKNSLEEKEKINNNLNLINENKIKKLENENKNITNEHEKFLGKTAQLLKNVLNKLNEINSMLNKNKNIKNKNLQLINLIEEISKNNIKSNIDIISNAILKKFESIIPLIKGGETKNNNYLKKSTEDIRLFFPAFKDNLNCDKKKNKNNEKQNKKKDIEINIIYSSQYECYQNIFGVRNLLKIISKILN